MTELGQVDAVHRLDVVADVQLVTPLTEKQEGRENEDMDQMEGDKNEPKYKLG